MRISKKLLLIMVVFMIYQVFIYGNFTSLDLNSEKLISKINFAPFYPPGGYISKMDILSNIIFFFIFGFVFFYAYGQKRGFNIFIFSMAILSGIILAGTVEFVELFMVSRVASLFDVVFALIGTSLGYLTGFISFQLVGRVYETRLRNVFINRPLYFFVLIYALIVFLEAVLPFDFSFQVSDIWHHLKSLKSMQLEKFEIPGLLFNHKVLIFLIFGFFLHRSFALYANRGKFKNFMKSFLAGLTFALITEGIQIFIVSGSPYIGDAIIKVIGVSIGIFVSLLSCAEPIIYTLYIFILLIYFLYPFQFNLDVMNAKFNFGSLVPFRAQLAVTNTHVFHDIVYTSLLFLPMGFYPYLKRRALGYSERSLVFFFAIGSLFGLVLEGLQFFVRNRVFDITDVLYAGIGCLLGAYLYKRI